MRAVIAPARGRPSQLPLRRHPPFRAGVGRPHGAGLVDHRAAAIAVNPRGTRVNDTQGGPGAGRLRRPLGYNTGCFAAPPCRFPRLPHAAQAGDRSGNVAGRPDAARDECSEQRAGAPVVVAGFLRGRQMQDDRREAGQTFQAPARVQIADNRRRACGAQCGAARGLTGECEDTRTAAGAVRRSACRHRHNPQSTHAGGAGFVSLSWWTHCSRDRRLPRLPTFRFRSIYGI